MRGSVQDMLFKVLDALAKGFSICEINYKVIAGGRYAGMIGLESVKSKDPAGFGFDLDEFLNIRGLALAGPGFKADLPAEKFIIYTYMPGYELPHGQSDLRAAYKHWWSKDVILKFWNMYLEKFGMPTAKGAYKRGMPKDQQDDLLRVLDKIQQETAIVVPEDVQIELLEA
jgi:phage gp29-like protein